MGVYVESGPLRHRVSIQVRKTTQDTFGGQSVEWETVLTGVPCEVLPMSGREMMAGQGLQVEVMHTVRMRYTSALASPVQAAARRLVYQGRFFNILNAQNVGERNRFLVLTCSEGLNQG